MGYEHIIEARKRLQALGVHHLAGGGGLADMLGATSNFHADQPTFQQSDFQNPMNSGYFDYKNSQAGLGNQISDLRGLSGQQVNTSAGIGTQAQNVSDLAGAQGLGGVLSQQQSLASALRAQANGEGPNPALEQYKQNVNQAIAQNSGMIASQKGVNPALAARMAGQNAASMQQGAASNEAQLQAQQQLAAQGQLGNVLAQQGNTVVGQGQLHSTAGGLIGQQVGAQGQAGTTMAQAGQLAGTQGQLANGMFGNATSGQTAQNNTGVNASLGTQGINADVAKSNTSANAAVTGGLMNGIGGVLGAVLAHGGEVGVDGKALCLAHALMARGGEVPGTPRYQGDDPRNDVVPAALSKGEVVLPNSVTQAPDAPEKAARFLAAIKERDASSKEQPGYGHVLTKVRALRQQMADLELHLGRAS